MIELNRTLSPPAGPEKLAPAPGMLTAKEYLTVAGGVLAEGSGRSEQFLCPFRPGGRFLPDRHVRCKPISRSAVLPDGPIMERSETSMSIFICPVLSQYLCQPHPKSEARLFAAS